MSDPSQNDDEREAAFTRALPPGIPGGNSVQVRDASELDGIWVIRFGRFGWNDEELRGGILKLENGSIFGGSSSYLYRGRFSFDQSECHGSLQVDQHGPEQAISTIYGDAVTQFDISFVAQVISIDRLEGYFHRAGYPDARIVFMRYLDNRAPYIV